MIIPKSSNAAFAFCDALMQIAERQKRERASELAVDTAAAPMSERSATTKRPKRRATPE